MKGDILFILGRVSTFHPFLPWRIDPRGVADVLGGFRLRPITLSMYTATFLWNGFDKSAKKPGNPEFLKLATDIKPVRPLVE